MDLLDTFRMVPWFFVGTAFVVGMMVGSFLNVVIYRLPLMLERDWKAQCLDYLGDKIIVKHPDVEISGSKYNLVVPRSACPSCGQRITALQNIPVLSYLLLGGQCAVCKTPISIRYPVVETITGLLTAFLAWRYGVTWMAAFAIIYVWALIALTFIDADTTLLPDDITLPLLWLGLLVNTGGAFTDVSSAILGAAGGYLVLWTVYWGFKLLTGKDGMGYGDFKLLAAIGAWLGWQLLPLVILLSAAVGTVVGIAGILLKGRDKGAKLPFGPYLAAAGFISMIWGQQLTSWYLGRAPG